MAGQKISALTALAGTAVDTATDVLPIVDTSVTTTKKILVSELLIALGVTSGTQASNFTFDGSGGTTGSVTMAYRMMGTMVLLNLPVIKGTSGTSSTKLVADTALPAAIRPVASHQFITQIYSNNSPILQVGLIDIATSGVVTIFKGPNTTDVFGNSTANCGIGESITVTYFTG